MMKARDVIPGLYDAYENNTFDLLVHRVDHRANGEVYLEYTYHDVFYRKWTLSDKDWHITPAWKVQPYEIHEQGVMPV